MISNIAFIGFIIGIIIFTLGIKKHNAKAKWIGICLIMVGFAASLPHFIAGFKDAYANDTGF